MRIKLLCYEKEGRFKKIIRNIKNYDKLEFSEKENGGQGNFVIDLDVSFDNMEYRRGDLIEYLIFNDEYKGGLHIFSWYITGIERYYHITSGQWVRLKVDGIVWLLSEYEIEKTYTGKLHEIIDQFISDFLDKYSLQHATQYLWSEILKNKVTNSENINIAVKGNFFKNLQDIFWEKNFFINHKGEILETDSILNEKKITLNKNVSAINIDESWEIIIDVVTSSKNLWVGEKIKVLNINKNINLENKRIRELAYTLGLTRINIGKIKNYTDIIV